VFPGRDHFTCGEPGWEAAADFALGWALAPVAGELGTDVAFEESLATAATG
jgi:hypothetical protein